MPLCLLPRLQLHQFRIQRLHFFLNVSGQRTVVRFLHMSLQTVAKDLQKIKVSSSFEYVLFRHPAEVVLDAPLARFSV